MTNPLELRSLATVNSDASAPSLRREETRLYQTRSTRSLDPGWAMHLRQVTAEAMVQLSVKVASSRLIEVFDTTAHDFARFELETDQGLIFGVLTRDGRYRFQKEALQPSGQSVA